MAFVKKTWKDRVAEYINRRTLVKEDGTTELVTVERSEGTISQEGDAFSAANMNDLEQRIADEFSEQNKNLTASDDTPFRFGVTENGEYGYIVTDEEGADSVIPFKKVNQSNLNISAPGSKTPSFSVKKDKLYIVTLAVQGTINNCSLTSGATQIYKKSQYRSCSAGLYMHTFLIRTTSTTVTFSINDYPAIAWYQIEV